MQRPLFFFSGFSASIKQRSQYRRRAQFADGRIVKTIIVEHQIDKSVALNARKAKQMHIAIGDARQFPQRLGILPADKMVMRRDSVDKNAIEQVEIPSGHVSRYVRLYADEHSQIVQKTDMEKDLRIMWDAIRIKSC